ncbi:MAG TPA: efflux RND transporter periplasmic adaptor subunit, partial [Pirellulales bacterium]|nr:efflux RND transporter periplasmic adaptor subunit [Pirellulales bacterium]
AHQLEVRTRAELEHMQRVLAVNRQKLSLVLGPFAEIADSADEDQLCELVLRSPLDGVVEDRFVSDGVQFVASQALFAVANTDTLWVSAQIYEREWAALADDNAKEVTVEAPALPGQRIQARVKFTAVGLSNETHAVPLVAELPNLDHHFKPGMFAWVTVPVGRKHEALVVPARSVMRQEDEIFVFVELESGVYRKTHVTLGTTGSDLDEVTSGLQPGQNVVDAGAFALKSELVLEGMNE